MGAKRRRFGHSQEAFWALLGGVWVLPGGVLSAPPRRFGSLGNFMMTVDVHQSDGPSTGHLPDAPSMDIRRMPSDVTILMYIDVHQTDVHRCTSD